jgi:uncharacterized NAD-dependent epimerase/dehydratase family protein
LLVEFIYVFARMADFAQKHDRTRIVILTEGMTEPLRAKTAACVIRYRGDDVVALLDSTSVGKSCRQLLDVDREVPIIDRLEAASEANTLLIGIAPPGGKIPPAWQAIIRQAIDRGMDVISGLHQFLTDDPALVTAASKHSVRLVDLRKNTDQEIARGEGFRPGCTRILTVGQDCSVGKMVAAVELTRALKREGHDAKFVATGQTGIMIEGDGCPVDRVISDFLNGSAERLVQAHQDHDILVIEGQGSLSHPAYSPVTLGLLHGARPHGMILCYEAGRTAVQGFPQVRLTSLATLRDAYELMASLVHPARVIGVAVNGRRLTEEQVQAETRRVSQELGLPACDVLRDGPQELVTATLQLRGSMEA